MQFMVSGMGMPYPQNISLVRFQSGEGHAFKGVHDFLFLCLADLLIRVPRQNTGSEFHRRSMLSISARVMAGSPRSTWGGAVSLPG